MHLQSSLIKLLVIVILEAGEDLDKFERPIVSVK